MHTIRTINAFICINNHVNSCIKCMLSTGSIPGHCNHHQKDQFFHDLKYDFWEQPLLFHLGYDQIIRRCISEEEQGDILAMSHSSTCGGHFVACKTADKILQSGVYWPTIFTDAHRFYTECLQCQASLNVNKSEILNARRRCICVQT